MFFSYHVAYQSALCGNSLPKGLMLALKQLFNDAMPFLSTSLQDTTLSMIFSV
jgi:hypothetical protein